MIVIQECSECGKPTTCFDGITVRFCDECEEKGGDRNLCSRRYMNNQRIKIVKDYRCKECMQETPMTVIPD